MYEFPPTAPFPGYCLLPYAEMIGPDGPGLREPIFIHKAACLRGGHLIQIGSLNFLSRDFQIRYLDIKLISRGKTKRKVIEILQGCKVNE